MMRKANRGRLGSYLAGVAALVYGTAVGGRRVDVSVPLLVSSEDGPVCEVQRVPLRVVYGLPEWAYPRGGVCVGDTFLTGPQPSKPVLRHEARHVLQWRRHGLTMAPRYWAAGSNPHTNRFEVEADLADGGYVEDCM